MSSEYSSLPNVFDRVHDFVVAGATGELTADHLAGFEQLLRENDGACRLYFEYVEDASYLQTILDATSDEDSPSSDLSSPNQQESVVSALPTFFPTAFHGTVGFFSSGWPAAYLVATVIFGIGLLVGAVVNVSDPVQIAKDAPTTARSTSVSEPQREPVGWIIGVADCHWAKGCVPLVDNDVVSIGHKFKIESGLVEIGYNTGAKVVLQGPITYTLESKNGGFLSVGKLTGKMTSASAKGFSVRTPTAVVTDLGTEFGVEVDARGHTMSHVFRGKVEVLALDTSGIGAGHKVMLGENESVQVEKTNDQSGGQPIIIRRTEPKPAAFVRVLPRPRRVRGGKAYADLVLSLQPVVYYRMGRPTDEKDCDLLFDSALGGHHGVLHFPKGYVGQPYVSGRFGEALRFRGPMVGDHAIVPDYPKATDDRLTVSAWVMAMGRLYQGTIAANWRILRPPEKTGMGQFLLALYPGDDRDLSARMTQRNGKPVVIREGVAHPFPTGDWQHVALVADGAVLHLYHNGVEVASSPYAGILPEPPKKSLTIGCKSEETGGDVPGYWQGLIDELAIFNRPLSADDIRSLYLGKSDVDVQPLDALGQGNKKGGVVDSH